MKNLRKEKIHQRSQSKLIGAMVDKVSNGGLRGTSLIKQIAQIDKRELMQNGEKMLKKRKRTSGSDFKSRKSLLEDAEFKIFLQNLQIEVINPQGMTETLSPKDVTFFSKMKQNELKNIRIPMDFQEVKLRRKSTIPKWIETNLKEQQASDTLNKSLFYGILK
jgi:hypothetical protein